MGLQRVCVCVALVIILASFGAAVCVCCISNDLSNCPMRSWGCSAGANLCHVAVQMEIIVLEP
jgi:hypothetical protein